MKSQIGFEKLCAHAYKLRAAVSTYESHCHFRAHNDIDSERRALAAKWSSSIRIGILS